MPFTYIYLPTLVIYGIHRNDVNLGVQFKMLEGNKFWKLLKTFKRQKELKKKWKNWNFLAMYPSIFIKKQG